MNIIPYRSFFVHKNEIEKLVKEMLVNGVIQHNISLFASSILLVKKKYSSWRFCVDYWQLNKLTIKNKFLIPLIDNLMDELHGSQYFSKLDLKSKYHQVRMQAYDIKDMFGSVVAVAFQITFHVEMHANDVFFIF